MATGAGILIALASFPSAEAVYTALSGDCVTRVASHGPYGNIISNGTLTDSEHMLQDCEAACDGDDTCSGFSFTPAVPNQASNFGTCVLKDDLPYAGWCDTGVPGRDGAGPCAAETCFHAKTVLPEGYYIEHIDTPPYGHAACQQKCAANARHGRLLDNIPNETEYNALVAILGPTLDCVIGYRQAEGAIEPAGSWSWDRECTGFTPPWHAGVDNPGDGHDEPNDYAPRLDVGEDCATMWGGKISDVTCHWEEEMNWLPTQCLCVSSLPCDTIATTTNAASAANAPPAAGAAAPGALPPTPISATPPAAPDALPAALPAAPTQISATPTTAPAGDFNWGYVAAGVAIMLILLASAAVVAMTFLAQRPPQKTRAVKKRDARSVPERVSNPTEIAMQQPGGYTMLPMSGPVP